MQKEAKKKAYLICTQLGEREVTINQAWCDFREIEYFLTPSLRGKIATFIMEKEEKLTQSDYHYPPHAED